MYDAQGNPMGGFALHLRRNFDTSGTRDLGYAYLLGTIDQQNVWQPGTEDLMQDDIVSRSRIDKCAIDTRMPGITRRPWIAVCIKRPASKTYDDWH